MTSSRDEVPESLYCPSSHLYPGAKLTSHSVLDRDEILRDAVIIFGDGSISEAELDTSNNGASGMLRVHGYSTAGGTRIPTKLWNLASCVQEDDHFVLVVGERSSGN
jgi:hypothetical protein